jgi:hypothetical protein
MSFKKPPIPDPFINIASAFKTNQILTDKRRSPLLRTGAAVEVMGLFACRLLWSGM